MKKKKKKMKKKKMKKKKKKMKKKKKKSVVYANRASTSFHLVEHVLRFHTLHDSTN